MNNENVVSSWLLILLDRLDRARARIVWKQTEYNQLRARVRKKQMKKSQRFFSPPEKHTQILPMLDCHTMQFLTHFSRFSVLPFALLCLSHSYILREEKEKVLLILHLLLLRKKFCLTFWECVIEWKENEYYNTHICAVVINVRFGTWSVRACARTYTELAAVASSSWRV